MTEFNLKTKSYAELFQAYAQDFFSEKFNTEKTLLEAVKYSFFAGGKRIRPVLMLACADLFGVDKNDVLPFALALECIHTYSLIHDDLPAMDDDDFRRGRLSNHKVFGEATAILAGDALLNLAFSICSRQCFISMKKEVAECAMLLSDYAGIEGMIGGQSCDVSAEKNAVKDEKLLYYIEKNKTGRLIACAVLIPCILAQKNRETAEKFGFELGVQFQIVDDILDVESNLEELGKTVGKDIESGKLTYVTLFGLDKAKERAEDISASCIKLADELGDSGYLKEFCKMLRDRIN